jgi:hypothetical protein
MGVTSTQVKLMLDHWREKIRLSYSLTKQDLERKIVSIPKLGLYFLELINYCLHPNVGIESGFLTGWMVQRLDSKDLK